MEYTKPALSFFQQIEQLESRGLIVSDKGTAQHYLSNINYYRFGTYAWSFVDDHNTHAFKSGTSFEQVLDLYIFDRELRILLLDAIERIEVSLRTKWAYYVGHECGSHGHLERTIFDDRFDFFSYLNILTKEVSRSSDRNIKKQLAKYEEITPAIWISCEVMSFGLLSKCYKSLSNKGLRVSIAKEFSLHEKVLASFFQHLVNVRNICAHHSRVWNRDFTVTMQIPKNIELQPSLNKNAPKAIYNTLVVLIYLLNQISPNSTWRDRLLRLIDSNEINLNSMGFPENWRELEVWQ